MASEAADRGGDGTCLGALWSLPAAGRVHSELDGGAQGLLSGREKPREEASPPNDFTSGMRVGER